MGTDHTITQLAMRTTSQDSPQLGLVFPLLNISLVVTWENVQVENNELACVMIRHLKGMCVYVIVHTCLHTHAWIDGNE